MKKIIRRFGPLSGAFFMLLVFTTAGADPSTDKPSASAIASAHPLATQAGFAILKAGGNAFDAAVAVTAALAVVEPYSSGLGGGGFWLLHRAQDDFAVMVDGRERAPRAARHDMYLDEAGNVIPERSINGALAAGIPGVPAGLAHLAEHYGRLPLAESLAPAIRLAEAGFPIDERYRDLAVFRQTALTQDLETARVFLIDGEVPSQGALLRQPELARTLTRLAQQGQDGFYRGEIARQLVAGVQAAGGIWQLEDLADYRIVEREPVRGRYHGIEVISAPPPSSGGVALMTALNILEGFALADLPHERKVHVVVEALRRAYRDRAQYLGDPDVVTMPQWLTHPYYAAGLRAGIRLDRATPSLALPGYAQQQLTDPKVLAAPPEITPPGAAAPREAREGPRHTTHFSILDQEGNRVGATLSINYPFGAAFVSPGTGVLLNDEMDDFVVKPGSPNVYGLVGAEANAIAPGKRMLSSMTPTFLDDGNRLAILGTPGGSRIISMVLLAALDFAAGGDAESMATLGRYHHQYLPDEIQFEPGALDEVMQQQLQALGHTLHTLDEPYGNLQVVLWRRAERQVSAAADPRGIGQARVEAVNADNADSKTSHAGP